MKLSSILDLLKQETDIKSKTITIRIDDKGEVSSFNIEERKANLTLPNSNQPNWINVRNPWWEEVGTDKKPLSVGGKGIIDTPEITGEPQLPPEAYRGNHHANVRYNTANAPIWKYDSYSSPIWNYMATISNTDHSVNYPQSSSNLNCGRGFNRGGKVQCSK